MYNIETENIEEINNGILDWLGIIDYDDKEQACWCRRNITELRRKIKKIRKENNHLS